MNKPEVGSHIKVVVKGNQMAPVFSPAAGKTFESGSPTNEYTGPVIKSGLWLKPDEFAMATGLQDFPVRVIRMDDVISIDGTEVDHTKDTLSFKMVPGSNGAMYQVLLKDGKPLSCSCPGFTFRKQCRHVQGEDVEVKPAKPKAVAKSAKTVVRLTGGPTKASRARVIFKDEKGDRAACIARFVSELSMSKASAQTYFYNIKGAKK
jgi:hypothetical protein